MLKKFLVIMAAAATVTSSYTAKAQIKTENNMKSVIVYFTHSGNTELAAKQLAEVTGAKMIRLIPEQAYSSDDVDWTNEQSRCTQEHLNQSLRPAIKPIDIDFTKVDTVFIGFPIWCHEEPAVIRTFLDKYSKQLINKVILPFCTSSRIPAYPGNTPLRQLCCRKGITLPLARHFGVVSVLLPVRKFPKWRIQQVSDHKR